MNRYWVSWWSGNYADEGCTAPPFQFWVSGQRDRSTGDRDDCSLCAVIDARSEYDVWPAVRQYFPDCEPRFCEERPPSYRPGDRFVGFENRTSLVAS